MLICLFYNWERQIQETITCNNYVLSATRGWFRQENQAYDFKQIYLFIETGSYQAALCTRALCRPDCPWTRSSLHWD